MDSLLAQVPEVSVLVVANDGGWDARTEEAVEVLSMDENLGYTGGMNAGLRWSLARGFEFVVLLTNDGWFPDTRAVTALVHDLLEDERIAACGPGYLRRAEDGSLAVWSPAARVYPRQAPRDTVRRPADLPPALRGVPWLGGSCLAMRTAAVLDVGLFDEDLFMYLDEVDWCYRALICGWYLCKDERVSFSEEASASVSRVFGLKDYYMTRNRLVVLRRYGNRWELASAALKTARLTAGLARRRDARWRWVARAAVDFQRGRVGRNEAVHREADRSARGRG